MVGTNTKLMAAVETYFADLRRVRASGGATGERSSYGPLANLLNAVGATLKPKVFCVGELADQGAGHPDFGLYAAKQVQKGRPREGQAPERGVIEVKAADDDAWLTAASDQVSRYWGRYRLVLVTNTRDFVLVGEDAAGRPARLESLRLADDAEDFARCLEHPRAFARAVGAGLGEYLSRALSHRAALAEPRDLAWLLASYARDGLARVEAAGDAPALAAVRGALKEALGVRFEGERGARFFRSTLVQTLFYGVFSAWVLWARQTPAPAGRFDWRTAVWHLRAPVLAALFQQLSQPGRLQPLGLVEVLDWTAAALDRVDRAAFFSRFDEGQAVPYFYEPFLEAFDPALRKQLGVWYTPGEIVRYMVARVDKSLKDDLGISDGLAAENVYILDPCCGTGAYLAEVLRRIAASLEGRGLGALVGARVKQAALERVFGFEIMPAPFVVAHLQVGLAMQALDAPLAEDGTERAGVFLTNALTGWEPRVTKPLPFPEFEEERDRAERVKREAPILVILGNPPYNGFAGMEAGTPSGGARLERSLRPLLPHGGAAHSGEDGPWGGVLHLQLFLARRAVLHGDAGTLHGGVRHHPRRLPERGQVQDGEGGAGRFAGPERVFDGRRPGGHPGGNRDHDLGTQGGPRAGRAPRLPPSVGTGEARRTAGDGGSGAGGALRRCRPDPAPWPSLRAYGSERRVVRLAGATGAIPDFLFRDQNQPRRIPHRYRLGSAESAYR